MRRRKQPTILTSTEVPTWRVSGHRHLQSLANRARRLATARRRSRRVHACGDRVWSAARSMFAALDCDDDLRVEQRAFERASRLNEPCAMTNDRRPRRAASGRAIPC